MGNKLLQLPIKYIWILLFAGFTVKSIAQEVRINRVELKGGNVELFYDLIDDNPNRRYSLHLYTSQDNFIQPMQNVEGDIGIDIAVGGNKQVIWHASEELGADFSGDMSLELQGNIYTPFIALESFEAYGTLKRGKPYNFTWAGGRGDNVLKFELYQGETRVYTFEERPNVGNTTLVIPTDVRPGQDYRFRVSDVRNRDEIVYSGTFGVKRKLPLGLKLGLAAIAGGAIGFVAGSSSGGEGSGEEKIVEPPLPR